MDFFLSAESHQMMENISEIIRAMSKNLTRRGMTSPNIVLFFALAGRDQSTKVRLVLDDYWIQCGDLGLNGIGVVGLCEDSALA